MHYQRSAGSVHKTITGRSNLYAGPETTGDQKQKQVSGDTILLQA